MSRYYLKLDLSLGKRILWPDKCALCGAKSDAKARTNFSKVTGAGYYGVGLGWSTKLKSFLYPVCRKHKSLCSLLGVPAKWTAFSKQFLLYGYRATNRPCENILRPKNISEKEVNCRSLMVRTGFLNVLKPALSPTLHIFRGRVTNNIFKRRKLQ